MDGALNLSVLKELFLRGSPSRGRGRPSRGRSLTIELAEDSEEMDRERRKECKDLVAVDLTGCVSAIFYSALREFVTSFIAVDDGETDASDDEGRGSRRSSSRSRREPLTFPGLQRLGLLGVKSIQPDILHPFILAFPSLTHLDVSCTRVTSRSPRGSWSFNDCPPSVTRNCPLYTPHGQFHRRFPGPWQGGTRARAA